MAFAVVFPFLLRSPNTDHFKLLLYFCLSVSESTFKHFFLPSPEDIFFSLLLE